MSEGKSESGGILKHSSIYVLGNLSRQIVSFIMLPIYTRYLSPEDYGVAGLLTLSLSLIEPFFGARLGDAIPRFYYAEDDQARRNAVVSSAFIVTFFVSLMTVAGVFGLRLPISDALFGTERYATEVGIFGVMFLTQAIEYYGFTYIRIQKKPELFISLSLAKMLVNVSLNILLIVNMKMGVMGLVVSNVLSSILFCSILTVYSLKHVGIRLNYVIAKSLLIFSWPLWVSGLASLYIYSSNRYLIRIFGSLQEVGLYELAARVSAVLAAFVWSPFYQYWETEQFNVYRTENPKPVFQKTFLFLFAVLAIVTNGLSLFSTPLIVLMSSAEFHQASHAVAFLSLGAMFSFLANFFSFGFYVSGATGWISKINLGCALLATALNFILIPVLGFVGAGAAFMLTLFAQYLASKRFSKRYFDIETNMRPLIEVILLIMAVNLLAFYIPYDYSFSLGFACTTLLCLLSSIGVLAILYFSMPDRVAVLREMSDQLKKGPKPLRMASLFIERRVLRARSS